MTHSVYGWSGVWRLPTSREIQDYPRVTGACDVSHFDGRQGVVLERETRRDAPRAGEVTYPEWWLHCCICTDTTLSCVHRRAAEMAPRYPEPTPPAKRAAA